ncbi:MAG: hypothetical protein JNK63_00490 [Chthonomonas sp.]|nr:hypothetical protein [Chthonomonas sp.]
MKLRYSAILAGLIGQSAYAGSLVGIAQGMSGYNMVRIDTTTGLAEVMFSLGMEGALTISSMTYDSNRKKYVAVAHYGSNSSFLLWIDPLNGSVTSETIDIFSSYFEAVEHWPWANRLIMTYGANYFTNTFVHYNQLYQINTVVWPNYSGLDMDTVFIDGQNNIFHLDVNNPISSSPLHRIDNFFTSNPTFVPVGTQGIYTGTEYDCAYHPVQDRVYVTRGNNLAYYNASKTAITNVGNYGGHNVTALAYGPVPVTVYGTLVLDDMIPNFAPGVNRTVNWAIKQGTVTAASGSMVTSSSTVNFSTVLPDTIQGYSIWEWDTGSSLKEKLIIVMPGTSFGFGTVHLLNGDADHSGEVDAADIDDVIANFGNSYPGPGNVDADVDGTGEVDAGDIDIVIACFGNADD